MFEQIWDGSLIAGLFESIHQELGTFGSESSLAGMSVEDSEHSK